MLGQSQVRSTGTIVRWIARSYCAFALTLLGAQLLVPAAARAAQTAAAIRSQEVGLASGSALLAGTLWLPAADGKHPAVVVVSGSGPNDRDGHIRGFPAYRVIAEHLAGRGIATLLLDRRGVGGSSGDWRHETIRGRARDALAAIDWLAQHEEIDRRRIGLLGHSQGGWVAQHAAARAPEAVAFVVLMAGPGESVRAQILTDARNQLRLAGRTDEQVKRQTAVLRPLLGVAHAIAPLCRGLRLHRLCAMIDYDPARDLAKIRAPVLALFAERDSLVPVEPNRTLIETGLRRGGNDALTVRIFVGANHQFWPAVTGASAEYPQLTPGYVLHFLETIGDWIGAQTASDTNGGKV